MTSRSITSGAERRKSSTPSLRSLTRRWSSRSDPAGQPNEAAVSADNTIEEEIDEIKRYEDFTTIDWVQDAARAQLRRRARRKANAGFFQREGVLGWRRKL